MKRIQAKPFALSLFAAFAVLTTAASAVTSTEDLTTLTPTDLAEILGGAGVTISNATFTGDDSQGGTFVADPGTIGFDTGIVLSSGNIADTIGPNTADDTTTDFGGAGDSDLNAISGVLTYDAAALEFDFEADADVVFFRYVFSSEEYNEYVNSAFNDSFGFFVNGANCAVIDDGVGMVPITINTINNGNPFGTDATNPAFYRNNDLNDGGGAIDTEMDGLTIVLTCMAPVNPSPAVNSMKLVIADGSDFILDSAVFLEAGSLSTTPPGGDGGKVTGGGRLTVDHGKVTFGTVVISDEQGFRGNLQVNDHRTKDRFHGFTVDTVSIADNTASWAGDGRWNGEDGYRFEVTVVDNRNGNSKKKGIPDTIDITVKDASDVVIWSTGGPVDLNKGNIKVH